MLNPNHCWPNKSCRSSSYNAVFRFLKAQKRFVSWDHSLAYKTKTTYQSITGHITGSWNRPFMEVVMLTARSLNHALRAASIDLVFATVVICQWLMKSAKLLYLIGEKAPPAADDRSEIACTSKWRCYLHSQNGGLIWCLSSCPFVSVGDSIQDELIDVARSGPQMAHYHTAVIYLCSPLLSGSVGAFLDQLNTRRQQKRAAPQTARCLQYQLAQRINSQTIFRYYPRQWAISCWWHVGVPSLLLVKFAAFFPPHVSN